VREQLLLLVGGSVALLGQLQSLTLGRGGKAKAKKLRGNGRRWGAIERFGIPLLVGQIVLL